MHLKEKFIFRQMKNRVLCAVTASMLSLVVLLPGALSAQTQLKRSEQVVFQITHEVSNEVLSPFCPGKTLAMCPSPAAADARRTIQSLAEKGLSKEEIKNELIDQYGPEFRRVTPGLDDNLVVFILVLVGLILCSGFVYYLARKGKSKEVVVPAEDASDDEGPKEVEQNEDDPEDDYLEGLRQEYKS